MKSYFDWSQWLDQVWNILNQAGDVTLPLLGCAFIIYYWLGYRFWVLWVDSPTRLSSQTRIFSQSSQRMSASTSESTSDHSRSVLQGDLELFAHRFKLDLNRGVHYLEVTVMCSPLLGLLGTVSGMMITFDSLGNQSLLSQASIGVAAGISEALFSTQLGLVISIPGLLIGRLLHKRQRQIELKIDEMCTRVLYQFQHPQSHSQLSSSKVYG